MTASSPFDIRNHPQRAWLVAIAGVLACVLLAIGYLQWRQYKLLDTASQFQNDSLGWSFTQLEGEQLRLRNQLQLYMTRPQNEAAEEVKLRFDIFVSRVGLVDKEDAARIMQDNNSYMPALVQVRQFVENANVYLGVPSAQVLTPEVALNLIGQLDALNVPLHQMSLGASHLLYQRSTERNQAVRQQAAYSVALTVFQCLLLLTLAFIVLRQVRALIERRRALEVLADNLSAARLGAETASRAKSVFLANMSHEIRTPFHGLLGMLSLLQDGGLTPEQASHLDTARESANHLLTVLNGILDISQLESGKLHVVAETTDLLQLITQVEALMRVQAQGKGLALRVEVAPDVPRWVRVDPTRLRQILFNLLSNALKFTPQGQITLGVTASSQPSNTTGMLDFAVTDTGIGMDAAMQSRLFQRFMQGDESPSRHAGGTGLGLEISRDLARLMGGDIAARSELGVGSTFTVSLPLPGVSSPALTLNQNHSVDARSVRPLRVLVAEDHPVNRAYMEAVLEKLGHQAVFTSDGNSAVQAVQHQAADQLFDIVLMDLHMPGMDGFSAARAIRAMPGQQGRVPIVALTADAFQEARELARSAGMDGFLTKPAHLPQLRDALNRYSGAAAAAPAHPTIAMARLSDEALIDNTTAADLCQALSNAQYADLLASYFESQVHALADLREAATARDANRLNEQAHALKGASLSLGLTRISQAASQLHGVADSLPSNELTQRLSALQHAFDETHQECARRALLPDMDVSRH
jgi:two-component system, sensor histidine kinase